MRLLAVEVAYREEGQHYTANFLVNLANPEVLYLERIVADPAGWIEDAKLPYLHVDADLPIEAQFPLRGPQFNLVIEGFGSVTQALLRRTAGPENIIQLITINKQALKIGDADAH